MFQLTAAAYWNATTGVEDSGSAAFTLQETVPVSLLERVTLRLDRWGNAMSYFEFLMVLVGLVGAIAISEILVFWGYAIRNWRFVQSPGLFAAASSGVMIGMILHVTGIWAYREVAFGPMYQSFVVVLPVIILALGVTILIPRRDRDVIADLEAHYFAVAPAAFSCIALFSLLSLLADQLPGAQGVPPWWSMLAPTGLWVALALIRNRVVHVAGWSVLYTTLAAWGFIGVG